MIAFIYCIFNRKPERTVSLFLHAVLDMSTVIKKINYLLLDLKLESAHTITIVLTSNVIRCAPFGNTTRFYTCSYSALISYNSLRCVLRVC